MIIGITGAICAGKRELALYLAKKYGFELVDLLTLFKRKLKDQGTKLGKVVLQSNVRQRLSEEAIEDVSINKDGSDKVIDMREDDVDDYSDSFCFEYYLGKALRFLCVV